MKYFRILIMAGFGAIALGALTLWGFSSQTEADIAAHRATVIQIATVESSPALEQNWSTLPSPVQTYFEFVFRESPQRIEYAEMEMSGQFRRPKTEGFHDTTAEQIAATNSPAFVFSATTHMPLGLWARAYDAYAEGQMDMKAKILSAITVVDEESSPELNQTSLRRWLLESPLYPTALLPGGPVRWETIDAHQARAIATFAGREASLIATFREDGSLERFDAETDGDLTTPYHGSGEHVTRSNYQFVQGMMIPMEFSIARAAGGTLYPFWQGRVTHIHFEMGS